MQYCGDVKGLRVTTSLQGSFSDDTACPAHTQGHKLQGISTSIIIFKVSVYIMLASIFVKGTRGIGGPVKMYPFQIQR